MTSTVEILFVNQIRIMHWTENRLIHIQSERCVHCDRHTNWFRYTIADTTTFCVLVRRLIVFLAMRCVHNVFSLQNSPLKWLCCVYITHLLRIGLDFWMNRICQTEHFFTWMMCFFPHLIESPIKNCTTRTLYAHAHQTDISLFLHLT